MIARMCCSILKVDHAAKREFSYNVSAVHVYKESVYVTSSDPLKVVFCPLHAESSRTCSVGVSGQTGEIWAYQQLLHAFLNDTFGMPQN